MADIARLTEAIEPEARALGLELVRVKMIQSEAGDGGEALQVMAEDPATGQLVIDQCAALSRRISDALDALEEQGIVPIYGLNWKDERAAGLKWLQRLGNPYKLVAFDYDNVVGIDWGVYGAPETFLIDSNGIIQYKLIGPMTPEIWQSEFMPLINAGQSSLAAAGGEG